MLRVKSKKPHTPIYLPNGRYVGTLIGKVFNKRAKKSVHLFRKIGEHGSWGIDYEVLFAQLPENGIIRIEETEEFKFYEASVKLWKEKGHILHFKEGTTDHYTQIFLPLEYFTKIG